MRCSKCGMDVQPHWRICPECELPLSTDDRGLHTPKSTEPGEEMRGTSPFRITPDPSLGKRSIARDSIIIDHSQQNIRADTTPCNSTGASPNIVFNTETKDGVAIVKPEINVVQNICQEFKVPGKYSFTLFPDSGQLFPAYRAVADGRNLVAKKLGVAPPACELDRFIRKLGLGLLPTGIARYLPAEEVQGEVYLMRQYCQGQSCAHYKGSKVLLEDMEIIGILLDVTKLLLLEQKSHGSLRPENIFLSFIGPRRQVSLADFAIYSIKDFVGQFDENVCAQVNRLQMADPYNSIQGTPLEVANRDAYALGVIAFELLGGNMTGAPSTPKEQGYFVKFHKMPHPGLVELIENTVFNRRVRTARVFQNKLIEMLD